jgi:hypothetical protein
LLLVVLLAPLGQAQTTGSGKPPTISDNSFLIEEAYNQDPGVVQHINTFTRSRNGDWTFAFTQEWPIGSLKHQFSYTISALNFNRNSDIRGFGDVALNYRYQLVNNEESGVAVAPRVSVLFPTGSVRKGLGVGGVGIQTNLPISVMLSRKFVTHWNAGATFVPTAKNANDEKAFTKAFNLGQSTIWLAHPRINFLAETVWNSSESVVARAQSTKSYSFFVNPGVRWAYNFKNGLQIVPGISIPLGVGPSKGNRGILFYLSFEHPFKHTARK